MQMCRVWTLFVVSLFFLFAEQALYCDTWLTPVDLSGVGQNASNPQITMNNSGQAVCVWVRNNIIQASTLTFGGSWSAPVDLSDALDASSSPQVIINDSGQTIAVWRRKSGTSYDIQSSTLTFGGSWSTPVSLFTPLAANAQTPQIMMNASGQAVALWNRNDGTNDIIESAMVTFGGNWSSSFALSATGGDANDPRGIINNTGQIGAFWVRDDVVQGRSCAFGGSWGYVANLSMQPSVSTPEIVTIDDVKVLAFWRRTESNKIAFEVGYYIFGAIWVSPIFLINKELNFFLYKFDVNDGGNCVSLWNESVGTNKTVRVTSYYRGRGWSVAQDISAAGQDATEQMLIFNNLNQAVVVWTRSNGTNTIIQATTTTVSP